MHIVIIGNGISGITAARFLRKRSDHKITVISAETDHFFSRTALMYIYMGHMRYQDTKPYEDHFWTKNRIDLKRAYVKSIDFKNKTLELENRKKETSPSELKKVDADSEQILDVKYEINDSSKTPSGSGKGSMAYDKLILAVGSSPNKFGWPGQDLKGVGGLYSYQDLERMEQYSTNLKRAVIVGGGLIGIEMAEMFHSRHIPVTFLVREPSYWNMVLPPEESQMINRHILEHGIDLRLGTELKEILPNDKGEARAATTNKGDTVDCQFVGLTAGVHPNIGFVRDTELEVQKGILVNEYLETNIKDVYAIGDCAQARHPSPGRRPIEAIWYTGRMMGETLAHNLTGNKIAYQPETWFNSAKFLDIEYQVYGNIRAQLIEGHETIYWEHPDGKKSIRVNYNKASQSIEAFNLMGVRYRHEVCKKWVESKTPIEEVLTNLGLANFDPEFFEQYEEFVLQEYNKQTGKSLQLKQRRGLDAVTKFLSKFAKTS